MTTTSPSSPARRPASLLEFLGSMNLAITLLVALAIASVIGTVLQQNQPYQDYLIKFGPFWFEVFGGLGLYDVYSAGWFMAILAFLVTSTSTCIYRNAPTMLRDMGHFRENVQRKSLRAFHHRDEWTISGATDSVAKTAAGVLGEGGYRTRISDHGDHQLVAAMKGGSGRLGYLFTHLSIVIICVGGLLDGNAPLKLKTLMGDLKVETRDIAASKVSAESRLGPEHNSFRSSVTIPEGGRASVSFIRLADGYLVQELPFLIEVEDFRIEHYASGQPKSFASDLVIHDPHSGEVARDTIEVNHPMVYNGYTIYQASFGDGGSVLQLETWPLVGLPSDPLPVTGAVNDDISLPVSQGELIVELMDFRLFNINPAEDGSDKKFQNYGPSFTFRLRDQTGTAHEFENYQIPIQREGRLFYLSGVRGSVAEPFRYLFIPADAGGGVGRFMRFVGRLNDPARIEAAARESMVSVTELSGDSFQVASEEIVTGMSRMVSQFLRGGFDAVFEHLGDQIPEAQQEQVVSVYIGVLRHILGLIYQDLVMEETGSEPRALDEAEIQFFEDAVAALEALPFYQAPVYVQLKNFEHIQATGLQIARAPGKNVVYLGCALLILGVFLQFYVPQRRAWLWIEKDDDGTRILLAGSSARHSDEFGPEFGQMAQALKQTMPPRS